MNLLCTFQLFLELNYLPAIGKGVMHPHKTGHNPDCMAVLSTSNCKDCTNGEQGVHNHVENFLCF